MGSQPPAAAAAGSAPPRALDAAAVRQVLPHGEEAVLVDHVPWLEPGREAIGVLRPLGELRTGVPRPPDGTVPPLLLLEAAAQLAGLVIAPLAGPLAGPIPAWLAGARDFRFPAPAPAGLPLTACVRIERRVGRLVYAHARCHAGATVCAEGTVMVAVVPGEG
ncbi:MAG: hypothetical protein KatS3mg102_0475 [Planctomycetota bacterium]|nr:MAG: hypothetical protein KatS3mg102_0475 [Planctomycetota bacterium]